MQHRNPLTRSAAVAVVSVTLVFAATLASCVIPSPNGGIDCAWPLRSDRSTFNVAYPDAGAVYFTTRYSLAAGQQLRIRGSYPFARYMSFVTYTLGGAAVDGRPDVGIAPDAGSDNPFTNAAASTDPGHRRYTLTIDTSTAPGGSGNTMAAGATPGAAAVGAVIYRVYVPDTVGAQSGSVPLPTIDVISADGSVTALQTCGTQGTDPGLVDLISLVGPATDQPALTPPVFKRPATVGGLYANPDNTYLAAVVAHSPGTVVVIRGRAATFPDTRAGQSPTLATQLRYWSFCSNEYRKPYPVTDCAEDAEVPLDPSGSYTIVVSTPADRPANATVANGVRWVDWGSTSVNALLILRNMLPSPSFTQSAFAVAPGEAASPTMGPYAPVAVYCPSATFASGPDGPSAAAACGL